ncbi:MAG: OsmC family protein [Flavobacterium sp.]|nr:OsmC family protein [Candidatus Neoflavobacterium equi]
MTSKVIYTGDLRTVSTHLASGAEIISDAPVDNFGKGEAFSPTDLVANALASCMLTVMGIKAQQMEVDMKGAAVEVTKIMGVEPRRIVEIQLIVNMGIAVDEKTRVILENTGKTCPVLESLHPDLNKVITFNWL